MPNPESALLWLQDWYVSMCDGEWEHDEGIKVTSSDNPGWIVTINVRNTKLEDAAIEYNLHEIAEDDWYGFSIKDSLYQGVGDPLKLELLIRSFKNLLDE